MQIDHDAIFKQLLTVFFVEFLELFFPEVVAMLERDSITFLDKESFVDLVDPDRREADLLAQARFRGQTATFIIHMENQAKDQLGVERRMFRYFARFHDRYDQPIFPIMFCTYVTPRRPAKEQYTVEFPGFPVLRFNYRVVQLNQLDWRAYLHSTNPLAAALMARMRIKPKDRWRVKLACLRMLAGLQVQGQQRRLLSQFVDIYLPLNKTEEQQFQQELTALQPQESEAVMEIVTSWELKGRAEGRAEATRDLVVRQLRHKFGDLPAAQETQLTRLTSDQLESLAEALLDFSSPADLTLWLATQPEA